MRIRVQSYAQDPMKVQCALDMTNFSRKSTKN